MSESDDDSLLSQDDSESSVEAGCVKKRHTWADGGKFFATLKAIYSLHCVALLVLVVFAALLILNGHYTSSGKSVLYGLVQKPYPATKPEDENLAEKLLTLLETSYLAAGSIFITLASVLLFGIILLHKTMFARRPWDRDHWNGSRKAVL